MRVANTCYGFVCYRWASLCFACAGIREFLLAKAGNKLASDALHKTVSWRT